MAPRIVPLFPLRAVLFPGTGLPLIIFEARYCELIQHCLEAQQLFGALLIQGGTEPAAEPRAPQVGTLAAIQQLKVHADGRMDVLAVGISRFRLARSVAGAAYPQAEIELLDEIAEKVAPALVTESRQLFETYVEALRTLNDPRLQVAAPPDPRQLSFVIASVLRIDLGEKQLLLAETTTSDRLEAACVFLRRELKLLQDFLARAEKMGYFFFQGGRLSMN